MTEEMTLRSKIKGYENRIRVRGEMLEEIQSKIEALEEKWAETASSIDVAEMCLESTKYELENYED